MIKYSRQKIFIILAVLVCGLCIIQKENRTHDPTEIQKNIVGIWHNGKRSWAHNYNLIFNEDGTGERYGYRNIDKGSYYIEPNGIITVDYFDCLYDYPGPSWTPIEGYMMKYYYDSKTHMLIRKMERDLPYIPDISQDNIFDNDNYDVPLVKVERPIEDVLCPNAEDY